MKTALSTIKQLSADEETRRLAFVRERAAWDEATLLKEAEERGIERGIEKGALENSRSTLVELLTLRFGELPVSVVERLSAASEQQRKAMTRQVLFASNLDEVF